jgi:hypothetical protein
VVAVVYQHRACAGSRLLVNLHAGEERKETCEKLPIMELPLSDTRFEESGNSALDSLTV